MTFSNAGDLFIRFLSKKVAIIDDFFNILNIVDIRSHARNDATKYSTGPKRTIKI
jgi:hypothetical protein